MDTVLAHRLSAGAEAALSEAYGALGPMVLGYLRRLVGPDAAEDVLQRTFAEVWDSRRRYDPGRPLEAWVLHIARQRAIDHLRRRGRTQAVLSLDDIRDVAGEDGRVLAERYVQASRVRAALAELPLEQREVLALCYFGDCTQREAADRLGVPLGTVKARAFRGLRRLGALLGTEEGL